MEKHLKKPKRVNQVAYKTIGLETIILDSKVGKEVHQLNEVAAFVWDLCDGQHEIHEIINSVCNEFDIDLETASADVHQLMTELKNKSLVHESA
jgi:methyltransferase-like protein